MSIKRRVLSVLGLCLALLIYLPFHIYLHPEASVWYYIGYGNYHAKIFRDGRIYGVSEYGEGGHSVYLVGHYRKLSMRSFEMEYFNDYGPPMRFVMDFGVNDADAYELSGKRKRFAVCVREWSLSEVMRTRRLLAAYLPELKAEQAENPFDSEH